MYLKYFALFFFVISWIALVPTIANLSGGYGEATANLEETTLSNQEEEQIPEADVPASKEFWMIIMADLFSSIVYFLFIFLFRFLTTRRIYEFNESAAAP